MIIDHRFEHIAQDARRGRAWLSNLAPLFEGYLCEGAVVPPGSYMRYHHLGEIVLADTAGPAQVIERSAGLVTTQALDHLILRTHIGGQARITTGAHTRHAGPGDLALLDFARPVHVVMPPLTTVAVIVPRRLLASIGREYDDRGWHGRVVTSDDDPFVGLLAEHLIRLVRCLPSATPLQRQQLVVATLGLCRAMISDWGDEADAVTADTGSLAFAVRRYIEAHLTEVDVPTLIAQFGLSRRSLYRLFGDVGGVHAYLRDRRLAKAMRLLRQPSAGRRRKVAQLAHECGFRTDLTFSRAFHRRYGVHPSDVVPGREVPYPPAQDGTLLGWLRDL